MKKQLIACILSIGLLCSACGGNEYAPPPTATPQDVTEETTEVLAEENKIVHIRKIFLKYIEVEKFLGDDALVTISGPITKDSTFDNYEFYVDSVPGHPYGLKNNITFNVWEDSVDKSFDVSFDEDFDLASLRQFITMTICATEPTLSYSEAENEMRKIISEYDGNNISGIFEGEEYYVYVSEPYSGKGYRVAAVHKSEVNTPVEKTEFVTMETDQMLSVMNEGALTYISGVITSVEVDFPTVYVYVVGPEGCTYRFGTLIDNSLQGFNEEQQYIFYFELGKSYIEGVVCGGLRYYE